MRHSVRKLALFLVVASCSISLEKKPVWPQGDVTLVTDNLGITHVLADSDADAMYGAGYAQARDRLFQMEVIRRQTLGTSSEIFGASSVKADLGAQAFDFAGAGVRDEMRVRQEFPNDALLLDAWVAGVNARIDEIRRGTVATPYGFGKAEHDFLPADWTAAQALAVGKLYSFGLSNSLDGDMLSTVLELVAPDAAKIPLKQSAFDVYTAAGPMKGTAAPIVSKAPASPIPGKPISVDTRALFHPAWPARPLGSNNWAVAGSLTDTGKPYVCGDPHQALTSPSRLWPVHVRAKTGTLDVVGFGFVGTPAVELGHNAHVGWTATTNFADAMDVVDVNVDPDFTKVTLADGDHPIVTRNVNIAIKGSDPEPHPLYDVPGYGVLIPEPILPLPRGLLSKGGALMLMWTGLSPTRELSAYLAMDRAQSLDDFEKAVDLLDVGAANFIAADQNGITYKVHARIPDRGTPGSHPMPYHIVSGMDPLALWTHGDLGADKLPHNRNPARGFLLTANNDPWGFTSDGNVDDDPFYYGAFYAKGFRAKRIDDALGQLASSGKKIGRADMEALQADTKSTMAPGLLMALADAIGALGTDPSLSMWAMRDDLKSLAAALAAWDQTYSLDAGEPVVFMALVSYATKRAFEAPMTPAIFDGLQSAGPELFAAMLKNALEDKFPSADFFPNGKRAFLLQSLDDAAAWVKSHFGSLDTKTFRLRDIQAAHFDAIDPGRLEVPDVPKAGGFDTIDVAAVGFFSMGTPQQRWVTTLASLYRMVIGFGADGTPEATFDTARGVSGEPDSPHFADLHPAWTAREHVPLSFRQADIDAHTELTVVLKGLATKK